MKHKYEAGLIDINKIKEIASWALDYIMLFYFPIT